MKPQTNQDEKEIVVAMEIELEVEELEEVIAAGRIPNHNETLVSDEVELVVEELEEVIAPGVRLQHNETLVRDLAD